MYTAEISMKLNYFNILWEQSFITKLMLSGKRTDAF